MSIRRALPPFHALLACGVTLGVTLGACWAAEPATSAARPSTIPAESQPASTAGADLPDIGTPADATLTKADEQQLGRMIFRGLRDQGELLEDPEVNEYLQSLGTRLAAQTGDDNQNYTYFMVKDRDVNAFALYGGFIGVNAGLMLLTDNESQLASVLGHETAHVKQRHLARAIQAQSRTALASTAALLAALLIGAASGGNSQAMIGAFAMSQGIAMQQSINFTRSEEAEADRVGITLLAGAGFDTTAMADFFEGLSRIEGVSEAGPLDLLRDHPVTRERIAEARTRAAQYPRVQPPSSFSYLLMRERVRVLTAPPQATAQAYYRTLAATRPLTTAEQYGQALAQMRNNQAPIAVVTLSKLLDAHPESTPLHAALGQALLAAGENDAALARFARAAQLFPRNVPIIVRYSEALMQSGQAGKAHELLLDLFNNVEPTPDQIRLTALAASSSGDAADAYYYMGEYHLSGGDLALAMQQLELALSTPGISYVQQQRFRARLDEVRGWAREQANSRHGGNGGGQGG